MRSNGRLVLRPWTPIRQGVNEHFGGFHAHGATGLQLRHDHGSQFMSDDFQNEIRFLGIESSPAFVREPEGQRLHRTFFQNAQGTIALGVLPPLSVGEMTLRFYGALNYSQNSARDLRCALNGA